MITLLIEATTERSRPGIRFKTPQQMECPWLVKKITRILKFIALLHIVFNFIFVDENLHVPLYLSVGGQELSRQN